MSKHKRRIKLIKPRLQIRLTMTFVGLAAMGLVLQFLLLMARMSKHSVEFPGEGSRLFDQLDSLLLNALLTSALLFLPLIFAVGILSTFKLAGPIYRFERFLQQVANGERGARCSLRKGDELQELCDLLNRAIAKLESERAETEIELEGGAEGASQSTEGPARPRAIA